MGDASGAKGGSWSAVDQWKGAGGGDFIAPKLYPVVKSAGVGLRQEVSLVEFRHVDRDIKGGDAHSVPAGNSRVVANAALQMSSSSTVVVNRVVADAVYADPEGVIRTFTTGEVDEMLDREEGTVAPNLVAGYPEYAGSGMSVGGDSTTEGSEVDMESTEGNRSRLEARGRRSFRSGMAGREGRARDTSSEGGGPPRLGMQKTGYAANDPPFPERAEIFAWLRSQPRPWLTPVVKRNALQDFGLVDASDREALCQECEAAITYSRMAAAFLCSSGPGSPVDLGTWKDLLNSR